MSADTQHRAWFTAARERACLSQDQLARMIGTAPRTVNNWERGRTMPAVPKRRPLAEALGLTTDELNRHLGVASAPDPAPLNSNGAFERITGWLAMHERAERTAYAIGSLDTHAFPALAQTEPYAGAVERSGHRNVTVDEIEHLVEMRLDRATVLDTGAEYVAIIAAHLLHATVGGPDVMAAQLRHLLDLADRPNVTLLVIDSEHLAAAPGPFMLLATCGPTPDIATEIGVNGAHSDEGPAAAAEHVRLFEHLRSLARSPEASRREIARAADRYTARVTHERNPA